MPAPRLLMRHLRDLLRLRLANGLSQEAVAEKLSVSRWTVNSIETGRRQPSFEMAQQIESLTGISRHDLRPDIYGPAPAKTDSEAA